MYNGRLFLKYTIILMPEQIFQIYQNNVITSEKFLLCVPSIYSVIIIKKKNLFMHKVMHGEIKQNKYHITVF